MALAPNTAYGLLNPGTTTPTAQNAPLPPPDAVVGNSQYGGQFTPNPLPAPPTFLPPDSVVGNSDFGGQFSGAAPTPPVAPPPPAAPNFNPSTDPNVLAADALDHQGLGQLDSWLRSQREKAIIGFGDPSLASEAGFGLDPQAGAFAQQNYLSGNATLSRLDKQHNLARQAIVNQLAAHGLLNSGDLGYQEGNADQQYGNQVYDAKQSVLDFLSSLLSNYNQQQQALKQQTITARQNALNSFLSNPDAYTQAFG